MLRRSVLAAVWAGIAYLACGFFGSLLITVNVPVVLALGSFLKEFAGVISALVFFYILVTDVAPRLP